MTGHPTISFSPDISRENSFDFLRLLFAFSVFVDHFQILTATSIMKWPISSSMGVAGFFIISGFLITRSYYRSSGLVDYTVKRIRRIVPAYCLVVIACALFLSFISAFSFSDYFRSKDFGRYVLFNLSFLNFFQYSLPGVFENNTMPVVNGSLWTIKVELTLYAIVPFLTFLLKKYKPALVLFAAYFLSFLFFYYMSYLYERSGSEFYLILRRQFVGQARFFVAGIIVLFFFDLIRSRIKWILPLVALVFLSKYVVQNWLIEALYPLSFAILIVWFAYFFRKLSVFSKYGDFSYGFYLFHFPMVQLAVHFGWLKERPTLLFAACFFAVLFLSCLSWHLLEKRLLRRNTR